MGVEKRRRDIQDLDVEASNLVERFGRRAAQHVVDNMQSALRAGAEEQATAQQQLLRRVEQMLRVR